MRGRDVIVAFDDIVEGTGNVYSSSFVDLPLGELESYAIQAVVDPVSGNGCTQVTVQLETSADGRWWISKNSAAEIVLLTPAVQTYTAEGYDIGVNAALARVRVRVRLGGAAGCAAHVMVLVRQGPKIGFIPPGISGCALWLRADLGITLNGSTVSAWADQSWAGDSNRNATQGNAALQPGYTASNASFNGLPTVDFSSQFILSTGTWSTPLTQPFTAFVVMRQPTTATQGWAFDSHAGTECGITSNGTTAFRMYAGAFGNGISCSNNTTYALIGVFNGASSLLYVSQNTGQAAGTIGSAAPSPVDVGNAQGNTANEVGSIAEVGFYYATLAPGQIALLNAYLAARYGLTIGP